MWVRISFKTLSWPNKVHLRARSSLQTASLPPRPSPQQSSAVFRYLSGEEELRNSCLVSPALPCDYPDTLLHAESPLSSTSSTSALRAPPRLTFACEPSLQAQLLFPAAQPLPAPSPSQPLPHLPPQAPPFQGAATLAGF